MSSFPGKAAIRAVALLLALSLVLTSLALGRGVSPQTAPSEDRIRDEATRWLGGPLAHLPEATKLRLVRLAHQTPGGVRALTNETFREKVYLEVLLNSSREEDHRGQPSAPFDRVAAVSALAGSRFIPALVEYAAALGVAPGVYGVKLLLIELPANSFIQFYSPLSLINGVRAGTVSRQALLDGSVVYVNNDVVRLRLSDTGADRLNRLQNEYSGFQAARYLAVTERGTADSPPRRADRYP